MRLLQHLIPLLSLCLAMLTTLVAGEECAEFFEKCDPDGASLRDVPLPGPDLGRLYLEMLYTVKAHPAPPQLDRANGQARRDANGLCCTCTIVMTMSSLTFRRCQRNAMLADPKLPHRDVLGEHSDLHVDANANEQLG
jgi:hypothetical protein